MLERVFTRHLRLQEELERQNQLITDLRMPDISGLDLMREGGKAKPDSKWIVITAFGSIENAVEAVKAGASDYLTKPFHNPDELRHVIRRVLREAEAEQTISLLAEELGDNFLLWR